MTVEALIPELTPFAGPIERLLPLGGGCTSSAARVEAARGTFFLKHSGGEPGDTFEAEAAGLDALTQAAASTGLRVPKVLLARNRDTRPGVLLLEWIPPGRPDARSWRRLGEGLAKLHQRARPEERTSHVYGFDRDNFIGRLPQSNDWRAEWPAFFRECRLQPQLDRARRSGLWAPEWEQASQRLLSRLDSLLPRHPPASLLHGDLWSGNHLADEHGDPWLVDPAAYVGDRETDLAMTELFGGFDPSFHATYRSVWPLEPGYEERREVYNLYHLLNHLNLFGSSYASGVRQILLRF